MKVDLRGLGRDAIAASMEAESSELSESERAKKHQGWSYTTDQNGEFTARFGKFREYDYAQATGIERPGYGQFYFVASREGSAGAVSPLIENDSPEERKAYAYGAHGSDGEGKEWRHGDFYPLLLKDEEQEWLLMEFKRGLTLKGQITDPKGKPLPQIAINIFHNLGADTHTGHGGEIFPRHTTTDQDGRFEFAHVYPNTFYLQLEDVLYWIRSRVGRRWIDGRADEIKPAKGKDSIALFLIASRESPFRYFGHVSDEQGRPVAGAKVSVHASLHSPVRTWEDDHNGYSDATTTKDGSYEIGADSPYVLRLEVEAAGFQKAEEWGEEEDDFYSPGRYDFTLRRK